MVDFNLFSFYSKAKNLNILLQFKGAVSQEILREIGEIVKHDNIFDPLIKKSLSVFVELSQNIMKYSIEKEEIDDRLIGVGIILFIEETYSYTIYAGNRINLNDKEIISEIFTKLHGLNDEDLKKIYKAQIKKPTDKNTKGAGLGLIDVARKSKGKMFYTIDLIDSNSLFFTIKVEISKENNNG